MEGKEPGWRGLRVVLLDAGHTMLRPDPAVEDRYSRTAAAFGVAPPAEEIRRRFVRKWEEGRARRQQALHRTDDEGTRLFWRGFVAEVFAPWMSDAFDFEGFFSRLHADFATAAAWQVFDDVVPSLERIRGLGLRLAVVSNWDARLRGLLASLGLADAFEAIIISAEVGFEKPAPEIFDCALSALGARAEEAVHVGDSLDDDVRGALAAGVHAVHLDRGATRASWVPDPGYLSAPDLEAVVEALKQHGPARR
jgi:putative hydrolase of the HAD superfamily